MERPTLAEWTTLVRQDVLKMTGAIHPEEVFSVVDILSILYLEILRHRPDHPAWPDRDRFILAKSSAWPAYVTILHRLGYFSQPRIEIPPDMNDAAGVDFSVSDPSAGLAAAVGMCLGLRLSGRTSNVFALLGGPLEAGGMWETASRASAEKIGRLCVVVENCVPVSDQTQHAHNLERGKTIAERFRVFGWDNVVVDGHNLEELRYAFSKFKKNTSGRPVVIVAQTRPGYVRD